MTEIRSKQNNLKCHKGKSIGDSFLWAKIKRTERIRGRRSIVIENKPDGKCRNLEDCADVTANFVLTNRCLDGGHLSFYTNNHRSILT